MPSDADATFAHFKDEIRRFSDEREWGQFHSPKNLSMALAAEAAELMEHFLWADSAASGRIMDDPAKALKVREELADIIIYALEFANRTGIDVSAAVAAKIIENGRKYPVEKARGNSKKYTEL